METTWTERTQRSTTPRRELARKARGRRATDQVDDGLGPLLARVLEWNNAFGVHRLTDGNAQGTVGL